VSDLLQIVSRLEESGGTLVLDGNRIRYSVPSADAEAQALLAELRKRRSEIAAFLRDRQAIPEMPPGVRLIQWTLKEPRVAIETCSVVTDPALFARTTLEQLRAALLQPKRWVGWSVTQLIDRLSQAGVSCRGRARKECSRSLAGHGNGTPNRSAYQ
jgi:hypothetical protein